MNCRHARDLMHHALDGALPERDALDRHLALCGQCRADFARLEALDSALRSTLECPAGDAELERMTLSVLRAIAAEGPPAQRAPRPRLSSALAAAALLLAFGVGLLLGRAVWTQEADVTRVVTRPQIVEKLVPVVQERVVVREVPVTQTRVVYRYRAQRSEGGAPRPYPDAPSAPAVKAEPVAAPVSLGLIAARPIMIREVQPVTVVEPPPDETGPAETRSGALQHPPNSVLAGHGALAMQPLAAQ